MAETRREPLGFAYDGDDHPRLLITADGLTTGDGTAPPEAALAGGDSGLPTPTTGDAGKVAAVNDAEDGYELVAPSGTSALAHVKVPIAFNTAGLLAGTKLLYTPAVGEILLDAWWEIDTAWDGTTPKGDIGLFGVPKPGLFAGSNAAVPMDTGVDDTATFGIQVGAQVSYIAPSLVLIGALNNSKRMIGKFITTAPLYACVSQEGTPGGTDPGSAAGSGVIHLLILPA